MLRAWSARYGDAVLAGVVLVILLIELARSGQLRPAAAGAAVLSAAPLALRRRMPLIACLLCTAGLALLGLGQPEFMNNSFGTLAVLAVALYSLGRYARGGQARLAAGLIVLLVLGFLWSERQPSYSGADVVFAVLFVGGPWGAGLAIRLLADRERRLAAQNRQLRADQEEAARHAVATERARIARELHDVVSHAIAVTVLQARGARRTIARSPNTVDPQVTGALDAIVDTNTAALGDMRRLLALLRDAEEPGGPGPAPGIARLAELADSVRSSGASVDLVVTGSVDRVPPGIDLTAYRIAQEALTNVLRHAGPSAHVHVMVDVGADAVDVEIRNDEPTAAVPPTAGAGRGLVGIRERVAVVGGTLQAGPVDGGYRVAARLPYAPVVPA